MRDIAYSEEEGDVMRYLLTSFRYFRFIVIILISSAALFVIAAFLEGENAVFAILLNIAAGLLAGFIVALIGELKHKEKENIKQCIEQTNSVRQYFQPAYDQYVELANRNLQSQSIDIADIKSFRDKIQTILNNISPIKYNRSSLVHIVSKKSTVIKDLFGRLKNLSETYVDLNNQESVPVMKTMVDLLLKLEMEMGLFQSKMIQRLSVMND